MKSVAQSPSASPSGRQIPAHQLDWDAYLNRVKFCRVPKTYLQFVTRSCSSALQQNVVLHVLFSTVGAPDNRAGEKPEWCEVAMSALGRQYGASVNGVAGAIAKVVEAGILEARPKGRSKEYRVLFQNWNVNLKPIALDEAEVEAPDEDEEPEDEEEPLDEAALVGKPVVLARGKSSRVISLKEPAAKTKFVNRSSSPALSVHHEIVDGILEVTISDAANSRLQGESAAQNLPTSVGASGQNVVPEIPSQLVRFGPQPVDSTTSQVSLDQLSRDLTELLSQPYLIQRMQSSPPATMVRAAAMRLLGADLGAREFAVTLAAKAKRFRSWPFLPSIVQDCLNANAAIRRSDAAGAAAAAQALDAENRRALELEYDEFRHDRARAIVEAMDEGRRAALARQAELRLREETRWDRMNAAGRQSEIRQQLIAAHKDAPEIPNFEAWLKLRDEQLEQLRTEEGHHA